MSPCADGPKYIRIKNHLHKHFAGKLKINKFSRSCDFFILAILRAVGIRGAKGGGVDFPTTILADSIHNPVPIR